MTPTDRIRSLLEELFDDDVARSLTERIRSRYPAAQPDGRGHGFGSSDSILITYADTLGSAADTPLATLGRFVDEQLPEVSHIHLLPFFPSSGDGGFAVVDFRQVDPSLGTWDDVTALSERRRLMVDLVLNHISTESEWFQRFLEDDPEYRKWFHVMGTGADLGDVFRPRTHPLLTTFPTPRGEVAVWTTFSPGQADLNFSHPPVVEEMVDIMMTYVVRGASVIRLDAVGYLWKEPGTSCLHHASTHTVIKLLRAVLDHAAPHVALVTETNVPHSDNVSYFGSGNDEAQMVYNFSLPPLVLDAFLRHDTTVLTAWATGLGGHRHGTFLNFLASHDGVGLTPVHGLLPAHASEDMAQRVVEAGGLWSGRTAPDGAVMPYELNIAFIDALAGGREDNSHEAARRFLAAVSIQMILRGVPGVYIHSALGTRSWWEGPELTGQARSINRPTLDVEDVTKELGDPQSTRSVILAGHRAMLTSRSESGAFDPFGDQVVHDSDPAVFSLTRSSREGEVWCVTNVTADEVAVEPPSGWSGPRHCLLDGSIEEGVCHLPPYGYRWYVR